MISQHSSLYCNNQWREGSASSFSSSNPATGEILWEGSECSSSEINDAVQSGKKAFSDWSSLSIEKRSQYLIAFADQLRSSKETLAESIAKETGKPLWDASSEVEAMIHKVTISLDAFAKRCENIQKEIPQGNLITRHRPHGVVAVFGPYNFPGHLPNGHIIPALLAGNTIVFKPSELAPLVAEKVVEIWQQVDLPPGVLNVVQGGRETGKGLSQHSDIQGIFFTGSYSTGLQLSQLFGSQPAKILALEMGGNNPLVVGEISDFEAAAYIAIQSAYLTSGQRCTCARRLIIPEGKIGEKLISTLIKMIHRITIGPYNQKPEPFMGPVISEQHAKQILASEDILISKRGKPLVKMDHLKPGTGFLSPGLIDVTDIKDRPDEEIFGPILQVIRVKNLEEAVEEANRTKFGLSAGLLSQNKEEYSFFLRHIQAGIVNWNTPLTGASSGAPFGGIKCSGNFHPSAYYAADYCAYPVASIENYNLKLPKILSPGIMSWK